MNARERAAKARKPRNSQDDALLIERAERALIRARGKPGYLHYVEHIVQSRARFRRRWRRASLDEILVEMGDT